MARGPGIDINVPASDTLLPLDTGFRIVTFYVPAYDEMVTRLDAKIDGNQYSVGFRSTNVIPPKEVPIPSQNDELITPKAGVDGCLNVKVSKERLIAALVELVNDLRDDKGEA